MFDVTSDFRQFRGADKRIGLFQKLPAFSLVVKRAVMGLCIAMSSAEVVPTSAAVASGQPSLLVADEASLGGRLLLGLDGGQAVGGGQPGGRGHTLEPGRLIKPIQRTSACLCIHHPALRGGDPAPLHLADVVPHAGFAGAADDAADVGRPDLLDAGLTQHAGHGPGLRAGQALQGELLAPCGRRRGPHDGIQHKVFVADRRRPFVRFSDRGGAGRGVTGGALEALFSLPHDRFTAAVVSSDRSHGCGGDAFGAGRRFLKGLQKGYGLTAARRRRSEIMRGL